MDHHRLRLVLGTPARKEQRARQRRCLRVPGQLVWKDTRGNTRLARIMTIDVSDLGVAVQCLEGAPIPLYRLVYVQIDRSVRERDETLPETLRRPAVLSAVYRVGPTQQSTGAPASYALRLLVEPSRASRSRRAPEAEGETTDTFMRSA